MTTLAKTSRTVKPTVEAPLVQDLPGLPTYAQVQAAISGIGVDVHTMRAVLDAYNRSAWADAFNTLSSGAEIEERAYRAAATVLANRLAGLAHTDADEQWWARVSDRAATQFEVSGEHRRPSTLNARPSRRAPSERYTAETAEIYEGGSTFTGYDA